MMKRHYLFVFLFVFSVVLAKTQTLSESAYPQAILKPEFKKVNKPVSKAYGTILYSEDFDSTGNSTNNGLPAGWSVQDNTGNNFNWIWSNTGPGGQYSTTVGPLQSATGSNGYLLLPSDLYNTPWPVTGPIAMDASVTSPQISIPVSSSVILKFEKYSYYCCGPSSQIQLMVEVSSNGINWTAYDVGIGSRSASSPNPQSMEFDVSSTLAYQTSAFIRFRQTGASHYFFMVDDLELVEGYSNALELTDFNVEFQDGFQLKTLHTMSPYCMVAPMAFKGVGKNLGSNAQSNANMQFSVYHDSTLLGLPGNGLQYQETDTLNGLMISQQIDTFSIDSPLFAVGSNAQGYYRIHPELKSDSVSQAITTNIQDLSFIISDTVLARDNGLFVSQIGPSNYVGGGNDQDRWSVLYSIYGAGIHATTVSVFVANDTANIGASIQPRIWVFDASKSTLDSAFTTLVGSSPFITVISSSELGKWISIPLFPSVSLNPNQQYAVGWEQSYAVSNKDFIMGRDLSMESLSPAVTNFVYVNDQSPSWGWVSAVAGVRLNGGITLQGGPCRYHTSIRENEEGSLLEISPNPSSGQFVIYLKLNRTSQYTLRVRNILGQVIFEEQASVNGSFSKNIDLGSQGAGVYFVSFENGKERIVEKVIVQ